MTSTYTTVVNFSMNDLFKRLTRIELLNYIQNYLGADLDDDNIIQNIVKEKFLSKSEKFIFPRQQKHSRNFINKSIFLIKTEFEDISDKYIQSIFDRSLIYAKEMASRIGECYTTIFGIINNIYVFN